MLFFFVPLFFFFSTQCRFFCPEGRLLLFSRSRFFFCPIAFFCSTTNPKPKTLNPQLKTLNPAFQNHQPQTLFGDFQPAFQRGHRPCLCEGVVPPPFGATSSRFQGPHLPGWFEAVWPETVAASQFGAVANCQQAVRQAIEGANVATHNFATPRAVANVIDDFQSPDRSSF